MKALVVPTVVSGTLIIIITLGNVSAAVWRSSNYGNRADVVCAPTFSTNAINQTIVVSPTIAPDTRVSGDFEVINIDTFKIVILIVTCVEHNSDGYGFAFEFCQVYPDVCKSTASGTMHVVGRPDNRMFNFSLLSSVLNNVNFEEVRTKGVLVVGCIYIVKLGRKEQFKRQEVITP